ncbi:hypothetical protein PVAND_006994 [Polypedilum vanderplanki]|uniref:Cuticle protein n=1 Tax=Polypedilum vanderplanki TaxID=319348 RepID=A0A9J6C5C2_POLVA|nr:hypothetical protein PVAND_006994 [Polypedilum vanderplanki]
MRSLILQIFAIISIQALERPIPSMLLQPRDFNPHPFQEEAKRFLIAVSDQEDLGLEQKLYHLTQRFRNTGPVRFPDDPDFFAQQQLQQARHQRVVSHIVNQQAIQSPQYERIALTRRPKKMRIVTNNPYEAARLLSALSKHGRRVQNNEFQQQSHTPTTIHTLSPSPLQPQQPIITQHYLNRIDDTNNDHDTSPSNHEEKKHYKFAYAVKDRTSGDDFSHIQKQEHGSVKGSYKVRLPDGRIQITKYTADDSGYHADVTYEDDIQPATPQIVKTYEEQPAAPQAQPQVYFPSNTNSVRYTVTPTPNQYNHIRAPTIHKAYSSTTVPNYY